ncbi:hypothetical protein [Pseudogemmobacter sp. W21_MBD1_M6]|uniref:hypothetical protein n=1 Tax=Pseudogemmobacter sp. W21_MBD1_M6 TaxID=3240271 RepID=UPI003F9AC7BC
MTYPPVEDGAARMGYHPCAKSGTDLPPVLCGVMAQGPRFPAWLVCFCAKAKGNVPDNFQELSNFPFICDFGS